MMLAWLKLQQMVAQAKPQGIAIAVDAIREVNLGGGQVLNEIDVIDIYDATGRLYHKSRNAEGEWIGNGTPIQALPNAIQNIVELTSMYNFAFDQIRNVTGITREMEGIIGNRQAAKTVESSINSSSSAISDIAHSYKSVTRRLADMCALMLQDIPNDHKLYKFYKDAIGAANMTVVDSLDNRSLRSFGISIEIEADMQKMVTLEQNVQMSLQQQTIQIEDAMDIREYAKSSSKLASQLLKYRRAKREKEAQQSQMMMMQMNAQQQQQIAAQAAQAKQQEMMLELELYKQKAMIDIEKEQQLAMIKASIDSQLSTQDFQEDLAIKGLEGQNKAEKTANDNQMAFNKIAFSDQKQKENIVLRSKLGGKQNDSKPNTA